ncbi:hypothetical protein RIR_jg35795.t1 [Rhizophagus irregularis DAOM 181602=DAOM 197198]|nr:hypothetical protein RIR_jg35795.t1 [Rhizophagus irregularis DAOM 181602=DAOM 197198]
MVVIKLHHLSHPLFCRLLALFSVSVFWIEITCMKISLQPGFSGNSVSTLSIFELIRTIYFTTKSSSVIGQSHTNHLEMPGSI